MDSLNRNTNAQNGKARLLGVAHDNDAVYRQTNGDDYMLLGGQDQTHLKMQKRARKIKDEIERRGYSLDDLSREQFEEISELLESGVI